MPANPYEYFVGRSNARIVRLLEENPDIAQMVMTLLESMVEYCDDIGVDPAQVGIYNGRIESDGTFYGQLRRSRPQKLS